MDIHKYPASIVMLKPVYKVSAGQGSSYFPLKSADYPLSSWGNSNPNNMHCLKTHQEQYKPLPPIYRFNEIENKQPHVVSKDMIRRMKPKNDEEKRG